MPSFSPTSAYVFAGLFALLGFALMSSEAIMLGGGIGNIHKNAPTVVATATVMMTLVGLLLITMFVSGALLRDFEQNTAELYFASPVKPRQYLAGRLMAQAGFDPRQGFSVEDVAASWQQICDFEGAAHPADNVEALKEMMANLQKYAG